MFKKITAIILGICFIFALSSCGEKTDSSPLKDSEFIASKVDKETSLKYDEYTDYVIVTGIADAPDHIRIPKILGEKEVKAIGKDAFRDMGWVQSITIPDSVSEIGEGAFYGAISAESILLSENLYEIGSSAFYGCRNVKNVRLPLGLKIIGGFAFADCVKLEGISIPKGVTSVGGGAFAGTEWLSSQTDEFVIAGDNVLIHYNGDDEKVTVPEEVKVVSAFYDNFFVKEVTLSESVQEIGEYAFINTSVTKISLNDNLKKIGKSAFDSCLNLEEITLNKNLEEIGDFAFSACTSLKEITIPKKVEFIGNGAFARCENLSSLTLLSEKTEIGENICDSCGGSLTIACPKNSPVIDYTKENGFILDII